MEATDTGVSRSSVVAGFRGVAQRLMTIGENRLELLTVEVQEERERLLYAFLCALGVVACGMLAGMSLTAAIVIVLWAYSPVVALVVMTILYGAAGVILLRRLTAVLRDWQAFSGSLGELRKDRECLEKLIA